jgi:multidrug efflux pump subunit AcrB
MCFAVLIVFGLAALKQLPISLLPNIDVPQILIRVNYPNTAAATLEENVVKAIRENLLSLNGIQNIESKCSNHSALLYLSFDFKTRMDLAYIEANEKIDRLSSSLPREMPRPQVMRINTSDIPIIRVQVTPKNQADYLEVAELSEKVLKKRLEQLEGVSLVDINGKRSALISITPDQAALKALNTDASALVAAIQGANQELSNLSIRDGQYRYFVKINNRLEKPEDIARLPVRTPGGVVPLERLAAVANSSDEPSGFHLYNGQEGLVITVQKQPLSKMNELTPRIVAAIDAFRKDYPQVRFDLTQDQSFLLNAGIDNLYQDLLYGGILAIAVLFLFLGNYASPTLMSISIPVSLIITFVFFWAFGISLNIISLSGLALGIGMLIDNSIVVLDNITRKRRTGLPMIDSCVTGVREVTAPVISQVLTTVAVYAPLVLMSGLAGALVYDQAIALSISLGVSLLVAFVLAPLLYRLFLRREPEKLREDTRFYVWVAKGYHWLIHFVFRHKVLVLGFTFLLMAAGFWMLIHSPVSALPAIERSETLLRLDWNEPIDAPENLRRIREIDAQLAQLSPIREAEVGLRQFLLQQEDNAVARSDVYYACKSQAERERLDAQISAWLKKQYPRCLFELQEAPNAFTQLFSSRAPYFEVKIKPANGTFNPAVIDALQAQVPFLQQTGGQKGAGLQEEPGIELLLDGDKMATYGVASTSLREQLQRLFGQFTISEIKRFGEVKQVRFAREQNGDWQEKLKESIAGQNQQFYPLSTFIQVQNRNNFKFITADRSGEYKSLEYSDPKLDYEKLQDQLSGWSKKHGFVVDFSGRYFEARENLGLLLQIFGISVVLLYFILAVQFENLLQPLLVMLTMPLGIFGAMLLLYANGAALDVMAAIGFVVVLGIIVDDPILKVDAINRLLAQYLAAGLPHREALEKAIYEAGDICLKPLLMTSLTTSLALVPVLFTTGIGADLQRTLVYVIVGGLTIGTFFTTCFIPLVYWLTAIGVEKLRS